MYFNNIAKIVLAGTMIWALCACSIIQPNGTLELDSAPSSSIGASEETGKLAWWHIQFFRAWSEQTLWQLDALIAHQIVKPVLDELGDDIHLWRFHRRAVNDKHGHRFTFYFYASKKIAQQIFQKVNDNPQTVELVKSPLTISVIFQNLNDNDRQSIEDTSDKSWSIEIQRAWPYFAMGVSQTWLNLIEDIVTKSSESDNMGHSLEEQLVLYKQVHDSIDGMWEQQGGHAFLHHLNALFGYKELYIYERNLRRF